MLVTKLEIDGFLRRSAESRPGTRTQTRLMWQREHLVEMHRCFCVLLWWVLRHWTGESIENY